MAWAMLTATPVLVRAQVMDAVLPLVLALALVLEQQQQQQQLVDCGNQ